ncbi:MAG: hypothetical protein KC613_27610, partial [Myxococcales bacterium]|nr:hypothetical protein [Myxococcales bacterium]
ESRRSPHAQALGAQMARLSQASGVLQQAAKDAATPIKAMQGSAGQIKRVLDLVGALERADEAAAELASDPDNLDAAGRLARASAEALAQAGVVAERLPPPLNSIFGPLFAGIPSIVDQVVSLIEARDQRIRDEAGLGPMKGSVCDQGSAGKYAAPDAQRYCFVPAYKARVDGGRIGEMP